MARKYVVGNAKATEFALTCVEFLCLLFLVLPETFVRVREVLLDHSFELDGKATTVAEFFQADATLKYPQLPVLAMRRYTQKLPDGSTKEVVPCIPVEFFRYGTPRSSSCCANVCSYPPIHSTSGGRWPESVARSSFQGEQSPGLSWQSGREQDR